MATKLISPTASAYRYPLLIKSILLSPLAHAPTQEIIYQDKIRYDYNEFSQRLSRLANGLTSLNVNSGQTVAIMDWDSHRYLECFFAVPMMGAILHTINVRLSPEQIIYTINHAEDDILLVHTDFLPLLSTIRDRLKTVKQIIVLHETNAAIDYDGSYAAEYESLLTASDSHYDFPDFNENSHATTFYTTGTTGNPKGVYYSHRQLVLHSLSAAVGLASFKAPGRFMSDDVYMPITPMFHVHAWGLPFVATMLGVKQVYPGRYDPVTLLNLIANENVTFSHCVPTILHMLLHHPHSQSIDLSGWKVIIGGSALPKALCEAAMARGIDIYAGYGLSETCPVLTLALLQPDKLQQSQQEQVEHRCKAGLPLPLVDIRIVHDAMNEQGKSETGEIVVRSPWLTQGYIKDQEQSNQLWRGGYLHTGDIGSIDAAGYLVITDRLKDVIKSGGEWISSLFLENIVMGHSQVSEVAVIGKPDERWGERPLVLVVLKDTSVDHDLCADAIRNLVVAEVSAGHLSKWAIPEDIIFVANIDKTSVGKIDKKALRNKYIQ